MLLADRKGPYIVLVSNVLSASPSLSLLHTPGCGLKKPLQGACFPIVPLDLDNPNSVWDATAESRVEQRMTRHLDESSGNVTNDLDRLLPVCVDQCLVAAGSRIWLIPTHENKALSPLPAHLLPQSAGDDLALDFLPPSAPVLQMTDSMVSQTSEQNEDEEEADDDDDKGDKAKPAPYPPEFQPYYDSVNAMRSQCTLLCNVSSEFPKFLIHDMVALTSNTILVLNRHSRRTGVWQFTTKDSWGYEKGTEVRKHFGLRYLAGKDYLGPHGMVLSLDRKHLLVVETGLRGESQRGGYINLLSLHFYEEQEKRQGRGQVRVGYSRKLSEVPMSIEHWEERVILASEGIAQALRSHGGMAYERLYAMDGERFEDRGDEGLEMHDYMKPTVKGIEKCNSLLPSSVTLFLSLFLLPLLSSTVGYSLRVAAKIKTKTTAAVRTDL
jgi:hypothetical protein